MENANEKHLRVVVFQEDAAWVSQCIDYDLNGQGSSVQEALNSFARVLAMQATLDTRDGVEIFSRTRQPPVKFSQMFEKSHALRDPLPVAGSNWRGQADLRIHA